MALEIRQSLKLTQSLIMTQKLQQAIKLLQLSRLELEGEIQQVLESNPVLEDSELQFEEKPGGRRGSSTFPSSPATASRLRKPRSPTMAKPSHLWKSGTGTVF